MNRITKPLSASESAVRHTIPRSEPMHSKYLISSSRKYVPRSRLGRSMVAAYNDALCDSANALTACTSKICCSR